MKSPRSRLGPRLAWPALLLALLGILIALSGYLLAGRLPAVVALEGVTQDWRQRLRGPIDPGRELALVVIDDRSLEALGRWPLSRAVLAEAFDRLAEAGARVIAADLLFSEAQSGAEGWIADNRLAEAAAGAERAILPFALRYEGPPADVSREALPEALARAAFPVVLETSQSSGMPGASGVLAPLAGMAWGTSAAHVNVLLDADGILRQAHPALRYGEAWLPSLALEALLLYRGLPRDALLLVPGKEVRLGDLAVELGAEGGLPLAFYGPAGSFETWSLLELLEGAVPAGALAGRIVLIGTSATGTGDTFATPFARTVSGVEIHATALANMLAGPLLAPAEAAGPWDLLAILTLGTAAALLALLVGSALLALAGLAGLLLLQGLGAQLAFQEAGLLLNVTFPVLAALLCFGLLRLWRGLAERRLARESDRQRRNLARYVPLGLEEALSGADKPFALDRSQDAAVMFVDLVGFTTLNEQLSPEAAMSLLREFHARFERAVQRHGGIIGAFIGDGAMAAFGLLESRSDDARRALACGQDFARDVLAWNRDLAAEGRPPMKIGLGLHYGPIQAGDIGGERQFQFTAVGDVVNVASRLQSLTREVPYLLLASEELVAQARLGAGEDPAAGLERLPDREIRGRVGKLGLWGWAGPENERDSS